MEQTKQIEKFARAMRAAQAEMEPAKRTAANPEFGNTYADQLAVHEAIRAQLFKHGITYSQDVEFDQGQYFAVVSLTHESGQGIKCRNPIAAEPKHGTHRWEGASTYAHRICLARACGLPIGKDDDGNAGAGNARQQQQAQRQQRGRWDEVIKAAIASAEAMTTALQVEEFMGHLAATYPDENHPVRRAVREPLKARRRKLLAQEKEQQAQQQTDEAA